MTTKYTEARNAIDAPGAVGSPVERPVRPSDTKHEVSLSAQVGPDADIDAYERWAARENKPVHIVNRRHAIEIWKAAIAYERSRWLAG